MTGNDYFSRGVSRSIAKSKMEVFVTKYNTWKLLTFVTKSSILHFAVVLNTSLFRVGYSLVRKVEKEAPDRMKIS